MGQYTQTFMISLLLLLAATGCNSNGGKGNATTGTTIDQYQWLIGQWKLGERADGKVIWEVWQQQSPTVYAGAACSLNAEGDTTGTEKITISKKEGGIFFTAEVAHNGRPVDFKLTSADAYHLVFENPDHDFPKKIIYQRVGDTKLKATIGDDQKTIDFNYIRQQ